MVVIWGEGPYHTGLLVAKYVKNCQGLCQEMRSMWRHLKSFFQSMAIRVVGSGYSGPIPKSNRESKAVSR